MDYTTSVAYNYNETTKQYTKCYPLTHMNAVYTKDDESETLGNKLADIDNQIQGTERVFLSDTEPTKDGIWFDTSDQTSETEIGENSIVTEIKSYINDGVQSEVKNARGTYSNLGDRLNNVNTQLSEIVQEQTSQNNNIANKVDKVVGKGLSTNDYTDSEKAQVATNTNNIANNTANIATHTSQIASLASGAPMPVSLVANMTNTAKIYVYTGSESGYTSGNWYYYNGSTWMSGGVYQSTGIADNTVTESSLTFLPNMNVLSTVGSIDITYSGDSATMSLGCIGGAYPTIKFWYYKNIGNNISVDLGIDKINYTIPAWASLIWDWDSNTVRVINYGDTKPSKFIVLAQNELGHLVTGYLYHLYNEKRINKYDDFITKENQIIYFTLPDTVYINNTVYYNGWAFFKFSGNIVVQKYNVNIDYSAFKTQIGASTANSWEGVTDCIYITDGQCIVFDTVSNTFKYRNWGAFNSKTDILIAYNSAGRIIKGIALNVTTPELLRNSSVITNAIPHTFNSYIKNTSKGAISKTLANLDSTNIAFISDLHTTESEDGYTLMGHNVLNKVWKGLGIDVVINGGDNILYGDKTKNLSEHVRVATKMNPQMLYAVGNHDGNGRDNNPETQSYDEIITNSELYAIYGKALDKKVVWGSKSNLYYYYEVDNIRIIVLNSNDIPFIKNTDGSIKYNPNVVYGYRQEQLDWLRNVALNTNKHVLIVSHIPLLSHYEGMYYNYSMPNNHMAVRRILEAYKNGASYSFYQNYDDKSEFNVSIDGSFTSQGNIICCIAGHIHYDDFKVLNGINYVSINCDWAKSWTNTNVDETGVLPTIPDRVVGQWNQFCFDIINIDTNSRKVSMSRFGVGSDREFTY